MKKRVLIVEDSEDMRVLYRRLFRKKTQIEFAEEEKSENALIKLKEYKPHLMIIDISLPGTDGITLTSKIKVLYPGIKVLIATGHDRDTYYAAALNAGADDFVTKGDGYDLIEKTMRLLKLSS